MPRNQNLQCPANTFTQITDANVGAIRVQNLSGYSLQLLATNGTTPPTSTSGAIVLGGNEILAANYLLSEIWPGVAGANRVWVYSDIGCVVSVSHA